ncbi:MAG: efflux RND transporter periplasmic adaptor subunit [Gemmatimonadaceae bacterium]
MNQSERRLHRATMLGVAAAILLGACAKKDADDASAEEGAKPVVTASTMTASVEPFTHTISAIGSVVARPGRYAALSAPSPTRIARVYVAPGQRVAAGARLVEFEQVGFDAAANGAQAALTAAQRNYERADRLSREGIVPRKDAEQAAAELAAARNAAVIARRGQQLSVLRSPIAGVVTRMSAVLGASADAGQTLVEIADPSAFDVVLSLGPTEAGEVHQGARVGLAVGEKSGGESLGAGTVASVGAAVDSASRSVSIRVAVTAPRRALRLGESVYGEIAVETRPNAVVVPVEALVPDPEGYKVFVVDARGTAIARAVKIGGRTETKVEILDGLRGGESVVTKGAFGVEDSTRVTKPVPVTP